MAASVPAKRLLSLDFEVFGKVQGTEAMKFVK
jgi:hypothetical protein